MSERYVILVCSGDRKTDPPDAWHRSLVHAGLEPLGRVGRIHGYCRAGDAVSVLPDGGLIIGTLFARSDGQRFSGRDLGTRLRGKDMSRWIVDHGWGRYVAALCDPLSGTTEILRDPAGLVPCYEAGSGDWSVFASDARLLRTLGLIDGRVDWSAVARTLIWPELRCRETCLWNVREAIPGERTRVTGAARETVALWSPNSFIGSAEPAAFEPNVHRLRHEVERCVAAWSREYGRLLLSLSGGLDSSILAATVPDARGKLVALTLVSGTGRGDETPYAEALAAHLGFPLRTRSVGIDGIDLARSLASDQPRPTARTFTQVIDRVLAVAADKERVCAHLNGGGGDSVFGFLHSANPAADRLKVEGLGKGFIRTVSELAGITHCTMWHIGRRAFSKVLSRQAPVLWPGDHRLLAPDLGSRFSDRPAHPWLDAMDHLLPGQREHIRSIMRAMNSVDALNIEDARPTLYPLLSQPIVELCLGIPTWLCCEGGRDRAIARAAFGPRFPETVAGRRIKGSFDGLTMALFEAHFATIRELLMDGRLSREGLLDREGLEYALKRSVITGEHHGRILQFVDMEVWASAWN